MDEAHCNLGIMVSLALLATCGTPSATPTDLPTTGADSIPAPTASPSLDAGAAQVAAIDGMVLVYIPMGEFLMGSTDSDSNAYAGESPQQRIYLDAFWIDQTEVTNTMYARCVQAGACQPSAQTKSYTREAYYGTPQYANYPAIFVTWFDAQAYCQWAGGQLPTEAQWEKAARGTDGWVYPWGMAEPDRNLLNFNLQVGDTTEVGRYPGGASPYGVLDMAGNAWEWVADWYDPNYYVRSPQRNPTGPDHGLGRVMKGGSWNVAGRNVRAAVRGRRTPDYRYDNVGFRCAR